MSSKTASDMRWYYEEKVNDSFMRHPTDGKAWKSFDKSHPSFANEPRIVRLGLASNGFQPFLNSKSPYSMWPILLVPYNMQPWTYMRQSKFKNCSHSMSLIFLPMIYVIIY